MYNILSQVYAPVKIQLLMLRIFVELQPHKTGRLTCTATIGKQLIGSFNVCNLQMQLFTELILAPSCSL